MLIAKAQFKLESGTTCAEITLSFQYIYCFYVSQSRLAVQILNFLDLEISPREVDMQFIGTRYQVLLDTDDWVVVSYVHRSQTNILITKIFKNRNDYKSMLLSAGEFGVASLYVFAYFSFYKTDEETLVVFTTNTSTNSLLLYRAKVDLENFTRTTLKTINNNFPLGEVNKFIWMIQCRQQM